MQDNKILSRSKLFDTLRERSGTVVECLTEELRVPASPVSLRCVLEQDTLILTGSAKKDPS